MTKSQFGSELLLRRFWAKVLKSKHCWNWTGCISHRGIGIIKIGGRCAQAPQVMWRITTGQLSETPILHKCGNRRCVNPLHLTNGKRPSQQKYLYRGDNGRWISEHRLLMERHVGRPLKSNEHVHHVNGDTRDNRLTNLELIEQRAHMRLHRPAWKWKSRLKCCVCSGVFACKPRSYRLTCSKRCRYSLAASKTRKLTHRQIVTAHRRLMAGESSVKIASSYGVTLQALRYRFGKLGIARKAVA